MKQVTGFIPVEENEIVPADAVQIKGKFYYPGQVWIPGTQNQVGAYQALTERNRIWEPVEMYGETLCNNCGKEFGDHKNNHCL